MELADAICEMVKTRQVIELDSAKDPEGETRIAEPHAVYIGSNSRGFVDFYQRRGYSSSGDLPGWRRLALTDIDAVRSVGAQFEPRNDYRPDNRRWYRAFVCTSESPNEAAQSDVLVDEAPLVDHSSDNLHPS